MTTSTNSTSNLLLPGAITKAFVAGEALDGDLGEIVELDTDGEIVKTGDGEKPVGVLVQVDGTAAGATALVCIAGPCKVKVGAAYDEGVNLASDATARAVVAALGDWILGQALEAGGAAGDLAVVNVSVGGVVAA